MDCGVEKFFCTAAKKVAILKHLFGGGEEGQTNAPPTLPHPSYANVPMSNDNSITSIPNLFLFFDCIHKKMNH